jgi:hypothetical protein
VILLEVTLIGQPSAAEPAGPAAANGRTVTSAAPTQVLLVKTACSSLNASKP